MDFSWEYTLWPLSMWDLFTTAKSAKVQHPLSQARGELVLYPQVCHQTMLLCWW